MIIAVDYDGTLELPDGMNMPLIARLRQQQRIGDTVILWTCREGRRLREALNRLAGAGLVPNGVNENAPTVIARLGYNPRKIVADVYLDDKAVR